MNLLEREVFEYVRVECSENDKIAFTVTGIQQYLLQDFQIRSNIEAEHAAIAAINHLIELDFVDWGEKSCSTFYLTPRGYDQFRKLESGSELLPFEEATTEEATTHTEFTSRFTE